MYKSLQLTEVNTISPAPKAFGTEPEKQKTQSKDYEIIRKLKKLEYTY